MFVPWFQIGTISPNVTDLNTSLDTKTPYAPMPCSL